MNIVLLGCPGSGKGTQAREISRKLGLKHINFGDIFWDEMTKKTPLGQQVSDYLSTGRLVPDWLVLGVLKERFAAERRGFLLDGFPRTMEQAEALDSWFTSRSSSLDAVVYLNLPEAEAVRRLVERRVCSGCGMIFNTLTSKPFMENACDSCGGVLKPKADDKVEVVKQRVMAYRDQTEPLISYYRGNVELFEIKADQPKQMITTQILSRLNAQKLP
jgi:adenylate kinase